MKQQTIRRLYLQQIVKQNFPKTHFELIIIDDCSDDNTYQISQRNTCKILGISIPINQNKMFIMGKRKIYALAIQKSKGSHY
jgi:glycosyltransferase involved in cell wall biosynthesis